MLRHLLAVGAVLLFLKEPILGHGAFSLLYWAVLAVGLIAVSVLPVSCLTPVALAL